MIFGTFTKEFEMKIVSSNRILRINGEAIYTPSHDQSISLFYCRDRKQNGSRFYRPAEIFSVSGDNHLHCASWRHGHNYKTDLVLSFPNWIITDILPAEFFHDTLRPKNYLTSKILLAMISSDLSYYELRLLHIRSAKQCSLLRAKIFSRGNILDAIRFAIHHSNKKRVDLVFCKTNNCILDRDWENDFSQLSINKAGKLVYNSKAVFEHVSIMDNLKAAQLPVSQIIEQSHLFQNNL